MFTRLHKDNQFLTATCEATLTMHGTMCLRFAGVVVSDFRFSDFHFQTIA